MKTITDIINGKIIEELPEIDKINIKVEGSAIISTFTANRLIPAILNDCLTNSSVQKHLTIFNSEQWIKNYLPLLLILFEVRSAKQRILATKYTTFVDKDVLNEDYKVRVQGNICRVSAILFSKETLKLVNGTNGVLSFKFDNLFGIDFSTYNNANIVGQSIDAYKDLMGEYSSNIRKLFESNTIHHDTTILYFTNKSSYTNIIGKSSINGGKVASFLNLANLVSSKILKVVYGKKRAENRNELIVCSLKHLDRIREILNLQELQGRNVYIVTDDFTELKPSDPNFGLTELFKYLEDSEQIIKVISILDEKCALDRSNILKELSPYAIYTSGEEKYCLNNNLQSNRIIKSIPFTSDVVTNITECFKGITRSFWQLKSSGVYDVSQIFKIINIIMRYNSRIHSFFDPSSFNEFLLQTKVDISEVENSLGDDFLYHHFQQLLTCINNIEDNLDSVTQEKSEIVEKIVSDIDGSKSVLVISGNNDESDHRYLRNYLISRLGDVRVIFSNPNDDNQILVSKTYDAVFIFDFNKKINYILQSHALGEKVYIVTDKNQTQYLKWYFNSASRTSFDLLKQKYTFCSTEQIQHFKSVLTEAEIDVVDAGEHQSIEVISNGDTSLESLLKETLIHVSKDNTQHDNPIDRVHLMFKDASTLSVPANKNIYRYSEDAADLSEMKCHAEDLTVGDYIFLVKDNDLDEIIDSMFETDSTLKNHYYHYKIWREDLRKFLFEESMSYQKFTETYLTNVIKSAQVIERWINGDTLMPQQRNFVSLLSVMQKENILTQDVKGIDIYNSTKLIKSIRASIPREIMKMYIAKLNGILYHADIDNETLLEKLYELVDIKKVALVIK